jgi:hypothetical protein
MGTEDPFPAGASYIITYKNVSRVYIFFNLDTLLHTDAAGQLQHKIAQDRKRSSRNLAQPITLLIRELTMTRLCSAIEAELQRACCVVPRPTPGKVVRKGFATI